MYKYILEQADGDINIFGIISLLIFFTFFVGVLIYVYRKKSTEMNQLSNMPFEDGTDSNDI